MKGLTTSVCHLMSLHIRRISERFAATSEATTEGAITGVNTNVTLQCTRFEEGFAAAGKSAD